MFQSDDPDDRPVDDLIATVRRAWTVAPIRPRRATRGARAVDDERSPGTLLDTTGGVLAIHDPSNEPDTVDAVGKATEALEYIERARGHLYAFHQLIGRADFLFEESAERLAAAGHREEAASLWRHVVGRDVLQGRWTFEIVEGFDDDYYEAARAEVMGLEQRLVGVRRHGHEEALRRRRRGEHPPFLDAEDDSA